MVWACFLHFYQPPTQKKYWIDRVTDECYRRIINGLLENPQAKITLNINSILCELWDEHGHHDVLTGLKTLVERGQIELTGSAKYHPLLPKLPKEMVVRQIVLNEVTLNKYFGVVGPSLKSQDSSPRLRGFFPPEMAYNRYLAEIVAELSYEWIITEELSLGKSVDYSKIYTVQGVNVGVNALEPASDKALQDDLLRKSEITVFFRDRAFSYKVLAGYLGTEKLFLDDLRNKFPEEQPYNDSNFLLTAMDGETFGHHRPGMEKLLFDLFKISSIKMVHISELLTLFPVHESVETRPSTWALMEHEVEKNLPFARWDDPENEVHKLQWQLTELAIKTIGSGLQPNLEPAQKLLDRALHSDQYWWASAKPWWSIEYIELGAKELLDSIRATGDKEALNRAQDLYYRILETAFEYQRSGKVDEISRKEDETIRMRTDQTLPKMPKEELLKIIATIRKEMLDVVSRQEYERAVQLRDRIKELEGYLSN